MRTARASRCATLMKGVCPYHKARQKAERAHIVIANHALLIADANIENRALPEYFNLIIDEGAINWKRRLRMA